MEYLSSYLLIGEDDWLVDRLSSALADCGDWRWSPTFLDLIDHPSVQRRWRAFQHFADVDDADALPALEASWADPLPLWVRADLADALLRNGSDTHAEDCVELVESEDRRLASVAIRTLRTTRPTGGMEALRRVARDEQAALRDEAIEALSAWPDDPDVLGLLLELSRSESGLIQNAALTALEAFDRREAIERLIEIAADPRAGTLRRLRALGRVVGTDHPDLIRVLAGILDEPETSEIALLQSAARDGLRSLGVQVPQPEPAVTQVTTSFTIYCGAWVEAPQWVIRPPEDGRSVRCWNAPHISGDPQYHERLEAGMPATIEDHFVSGSEHWIELSYQNCWIPFDQLDRPTDIVAEDLDWPYRYEFDVRLEELDSPMGKDLLAAGTIRAFDVGETVTGIDFRIDPDDRGAVERLVSDYVDDDSDLSYFIWDAMDELRERYENDPEMARKIDRVLAD